MKPPFPHTAFAAAFLASISSITGVAQEEATSEEDAIRARAAAYVETFNKGDGKALAEYWAPEATWTDPSTGESVVGREQIREGFEALLKANEGARLDLKLNSIKLLTKDVAVEEGTAVITVPNAEPSLSGYTAVQIKIDGQWLIERVIETATEDEPATTEGAPDEARPLKEIEWLEGAWIDESEGSSIYYENEWVADGNFLRRSFSVMIKDRVDISGMEIVGWDAAAGQIRSWVFDSHGSFAELKWKRSEEEPGNWTKSAHGILSSGATVSAVHVMKRIDDDTYTFEAIAREVDGELLPNIDEVTVVRASGSE